jgi:hypothetical protein
VTVETYAQLGEYAPSLHPALRAYAAASAVIYADEAFEEPVHIDRTDKFLLLTNDKAFYELGADGSSQISRLGDAPALGHLVKRAQYSILYPDDKTLPARYVFAHDEGELNQQAGDVATAYNASTPAERAQLVDMHMGAQWTALVYRDHLHFTCDPRSSAAQDISTGGAVPAAVLYPTGVDRAATSALLVMESGAVMEFGCHSTTPYLQVSTTRFDQTYKRVYRAGGEVLGLTKDGRLFKIDGALSSPLQTAVDGRIFDLVPAQNFAFFK